MPTNHHHGKIVDGRPSSEMWLGEMKKLRSLALQGTKVTAAGAEHPCRKTGCAPSRRD